MRVLIAAPRKTGNTQLRCLLAAAYGLDAIGSRDVPRDDDKTAIASWLAEMPKGGIVNTGYAFTPRLAALAGEHGVTLVGVIRHPYDLFVSNYEIAQHRASRDTDESSPLGVWAALAGKPIDDATVLTFLHDDFREDMDWLIGWLDSGAPLVRYERLAADEAATLTELSQGLGRLSAKQIDRALAACEAPPVYRARPSRGRRMPALPPGSWREQLSEAHLAILRDRYGDDIRRLGYEVA
jgi:hypothetical protein